MPVCAVWREARQLFSRSKAALRSPSAVMIRGRLALAEGRLALADGRMDGCGWAGGWDGIEPCWVDGWVIFSMAVLCGAAALLKTRARARRGPRAENSSKNLQGSAPFSDGGDVWRSRAAQNARAKSTLAAPRVARRTFFAEPAELGSLLRQGTPA